MIDRDEVIYAIESGMTDKELADWFYEQIAKAVADEREACAVIADGESDPQRMSIAHEIRAWGEKCAK